MSAPRCPSHATVYLMLKYPCGRFRSLYQWECRLQWLRARFQRPHFPSVSERRRWPPWNKICVLFHEHKKSNFIILKILVYHQIFPSWYIDTDFDTCFVRLLVPRLFLPPAFASRRIEVHTTLFFLVLKNMSGPAFNFYFLKFHRRWWWSENIHDFLLLLCPQYKSKHWHL